MKVSEEYKKLYHYTTWDGLVGILKNQSLWATHHRFLNDYSETLLMKDKLIEFARPIIHKVSLDVLDSLHNRQEIMQQINDNGGFEVLVDHNSSFFIDGMYKTLPGDGLYITSFCAESKDEYIDANGVLSQWRGYGQDGGFALVFDTLRLESMLEKEFERFDYSGGGLGDVIYSNEEDKFKSEFKILLSHLHGYIGHMIRCILVRKLDPYVENDETPLSAFVSCISRYKHQGFKEENEVRIYAYPAVHDETYLSLDSQDKVQLKPEKERKFRKKNGECVPYIELFDSLDQDLPIEQIIVGPHQDKETRVSALKVMFRGKDIEIRASDIPFIG